MTKIALTESRQALLEAKVDFLRLLERSDFDVGLYRPDGTDSQTPHRRDELYVVASGSGEFACDGETSSFVAGDAFFVAAGKSHRFAAFTPDFSVWVVFFGARQ